MPDPECFALTVTGDLAVAKKCRQDLFMAQVLAPRLELFGRLADILAELDQCVPKAVRIEIWQTSTNERFPKYLPNGRGIAPVSLI
jgi:hypothetical protein